MVHSCKIEHAHGLTKSMNPTDAAITIVLFLMNRGGITGLLAYPKSHAAKTNKSITPVTSMAMIEA